MDQIKTGKFIAALRKEKHLTQDELGRRLGVSNKTVSRWENGNYMPDIETLRLLGKEFSVSIEELLDGERLSATKPAKTPDPFTPKERHQMRAHAHFISQQLACRAPQGPPSRVDNRMNLLPAPLFPGPWG